MDKVTVIFTSCGRLTLLNETVKSFMNWNTYPIDKFIVIENGYYPQIEADLVDIFEGIDDVEFIINEENIGQVASIDKAYSHVNTDYIFHCEDDWKFVAGGFIEESLQVLKELPYVGNVNIRMRSDGSKGSYHPIEKSGNLSSGLEYSLYQTDYFGVWHGFSWNPGLRRLSDYNIIKPYKQYQNEQGVNQKMKDLGFRAACLKDGYCLHIGENSITPKSNS